MRQEENLIKICDKLNDYIRDDNGINPKATIVMMTDFGAVGVWQGRLIASTIESYAQYNTCLKIKFIPKGKQKIRLIYVYGVKMFAIFKNWVNASEEMPENYWGFDKMNFYRICDSVMGEKLGEESERIHVEEIKAKGKIYQVVMDSNNVLTYNSESELLKDFEEVGRLNNTICRLELQGTPKLRGLMGAMYNGTDKNGNAIIRYEATKVNEHMSI